MLFQNIAALIAKGVKLTIQIERADDGKLEVSVIPTSETGKSGASLVAKSFVATPAELDAEFPAVIAGFATANLTLQEQLESMESLAQQVIKDAQATVKTAQANARTNPPKSALPAAKAGPELLGGAGDDDSDDDGPGSYPVAGGATEPSGTPSDTAAVPMPFML